MLYCCGSHLEYTSKDMFGCLRKDNHDGQHLSYLEFSGFNNWERWWDCGCPDEEECQCSTYSQVTKKEAEKIIFSDFGYNQNSFPETLKDAIGEIKEHEARWQI